MNIRRVELESGGPPHYVFEDVSETELQIFARAFEYDRPYYDIPELAVYSAAMWRKIELARDEMLTRYQ